ncbi:hypothetical protein TYRP_023741 [Tyrophagus putrescentiae]|nr:hypothetical protein TYRP_023741 [Tyrophagus putrescentiae]
MPVPSQTFLSVPFDVLVPVPSSTSSCPCLPTSFPVPLRRPRARAFLTSSLCARAPDVSGPCFLLRPVPPPPCRAPPSRPLRAGPPLRAFPSR